jgi:hypothetical protein
MIICITVYNETRKQVEDTLNSIVLNLKAF